MKKLTALAAVLGLAVSSWGLTPQAAPASQVTLGATAATIVEAQLGHHLARGIPQGRRTRLGGELSYYANVGWDQLFGWYWSAFAKASGPTSG